MGEIMDWVDLFVWTLVPTLIFVAIYQEVVKRLPWPRCWGKLAKRARAGRLRGCDYEIPSYDMDCAFGDEDADDGDGDGDNFDKDETISEKERVIKYYTLALQEYNKLNGLDGK